ncbi:MAG: hypothetical protein QOF07_2693, partial [Bradyrhizobium sp.]|nr:hypothetical protein [Bradyrhizobium sp.]
PATKTAVLSSLVLPTWLSCPYSVAADPATVTCTGTPTSVGSSQLVFLATASDGPQSTRSYSVAVAAAVVTPPLVSAPPTIAPEPAPAPPAPEPVPPISVVPSFPTSGYASGIDFSIHVAHAGGQLVLVSTNADLSSPVSIEVTADGTLQYPLPPGLEGTMTLYIVRPEDGSTARVSFTVDTKAPTLISVDQIRAPRAAHSAATKDDPLRKWFELSGVDAGSGITQLQIAPRPGVAWNWRSFVTNFSAPIHQKTVRVRIADAAGNISGWFVVPVTRAK